MQRKRGRIYFEKNIKNEEKKCAKTTWHEKHTSCTSLIHGWSLERITNPLNQQAECHFIGEYREQNAIKYILIILATKNFAWVCQSMYYGLFA